MGEGWSAPFPLVTLCSDGRPQGVTLLQDAEKHSCKHKVMSLGVDTVRTRAAKKFAEKRGGMWIAVIASSALTPGPRVSPSVSAWI